MPVAKNARVNSDTPSPGQSRNHAIRKSYSVGIVVNNKSRDAREDGDAASASGTDGSGSLKAPHSGLLRRKNPIAKSASKSGISSIFRSWFKSGSSDSDKAKGERGAVAAATKGSKISSKDQPKMARSSGVGTGSIDSLCSVASTTRCTTFELGGFFGHCDFSSPQMKWHR